VPGIRRVPGAIAGTAKGAMIDRKSDQTRYFCKACKIWIANNKSQRDQHERGVRHKAASDAMLEEIARRNKERAKAEAASKAEVANIEAKAAAAMGYGIQQHLISSSPSDRAALLDSIAVATTARCAPAIVAVHGGIPETATHNSEVEPVDSKGYGQWEEVLDTEKSAEAMDDAKEGSRKRPLTRIRIGAMDAGDEEEAEQRTRSLTRLTALASPPATHDSSANIAIEFKSRHSSRNKRRRKVD
jgi:hypothetical protein